MKKMIVSLVCVFGLCLGCLSQTQTAADIIALRNAGVSNDVIIALINSQPAVKTNVASVSYVQGLDPESYGYFQNYYLYPRTLGYSYYLMHPSPMYYRPMFTFELGFGGRHPSHGSHFRR